jgi:hypothetical protein
MEDRHMNRQISMLARAIVLALVSTWLPPYAACQTGTNGVAPRCAQLEKDIPSLYLVNGLNLSGDQASKLAEILDRAKRVIDRNESDMDKIVGKAQKNVDEEVNRIVAKAAAKETISADKLDRTNQGKRLRQSRHELNILNRQLQGELDALADQTYRLLSDSQRKIVDSFVPCFIPPRSFKSPERVGQAAGDTSVVEEALAKLRKIPDDGDLQAGIEKAITGLARYAMEKRHMVYSEEAEDGVRKELQAKLETAVPKIRKMKDDEFELEKARIAADVLPLDNGGHGDSELAASRWKIRTYILNTGILDAVKTRAGLTQEVGSAGSSIAPRRKEIDSDKELRTAALIANLNLTREQASNAFVVVDSALKAKDDVESRMSKVMGEAVTSYGALRAELAAGQPTGKAERSAGMLHGRLKNLREDTLVDEMLKSQAELDKILTVNQIALIQDDTSDLKQRLSGHGETGGVEDAKRLISESLRMSGPEFGKEKDKLCGDFVAKCLASAGKEATNVNVNAEIARISGILDQIRKMDRSDIAAKKDELATQLCPKLTQSRTVKYTSKYLHGQPVPAISASTKLLFTDTARMVLAKIAGIRQNDDKNANTSKIHS